MKEDMRSKVFIFIPFCLISQAFQARGIVKHGWHGMIKPIVEELTRQDVNLIQMPCAESQYGGYIRGLQRKPMGIAEYDNPAFKQLCNELACQTISMIKGILSNGYEIAAILGIEYSPSCAVKYQYTNHGTIHRPGIFIQTLGDMLEREGIRIPFIGINRKGVKKSLKEIRLLFTKRHQMNFEC